MIRNSKWAIFVLALSQGYLWAAYLPVAGPVPLRFQASRLASASPRRVTLPPVVSQPGLPSANRPLTLPEAWPLLFSGLWPSGWEPTADSVLQARTLEQDFPETTLQTPVKSEPTLYPQNLVPFFIPDGTTNGRQPAVMIPVDFTPPSGAGPASSTAIYTKH